MKLRNLIYYLKNNSLKGFTLLELLIVIVIILLLAGFTLPALAKARQKALQVSCIMNLKQISTGLCAYSLDYEGIFPSTGTSGKENLELLRDLYFKQGEIFMCPSANRNENKNKGKGKKTGKGKKEDSFIDYFFAYKLTSNSPSDSPLMIDDDAHHPVKKKYNILFVDSHIESNQYAPDGDSGITPVD